MGTLLLNLMFLLYRKCTDRFTTNVNPRSQEKYMFSRLTRKLGGGGILYFIGTRLWGELDKCLQTETKAYIPLQRKTICVGSSHWLRPPTTQFRVGDTNMLVFKMLKFALPPTRTLKFALPPTPTPNACRWNIGGVGSPTRGAGIVHVHFMFFVLISFALGSQHKLSFQWNMGLRFNCTHDA